MKVCKLWLPALLLGLLGAAALICDTLFNSSGKGFFLSSEACAAVFVISLLLMVVIGFVMSGMSRKVGLESTTPGKNPIAGIFGFIASVSIIGSSVISILSFGASDSKIVAGVTAMIYMIGGIVLLYETCISFTGHNGMVKRPLLSLIPVLWCAVRLMAMFLNYQRISLHAAVKYDVISTVFLIMFMYYHAMYLSMPERPVGLRRMTLYGIMYIACTFAVCGDIIVKMFVPSAATDGIDSIVIEPTISRILTCVCDISFAGYAAMFIFGAHKNSVYTLIEDKKDEEDDSDTKFLGSLSGSADSTEDEITSGILSTETDTVDKPDTSEGSIDILFGTGAAAAAVGAAAEKEAEAPVTSDAEEDIPEAAPMTYEAVREEAVPETAPMTYESVKEEVVPEAAPVTNEAAKEEPVLASAPVYEEPKAEPKHDLIEELENNARKDEQKELDEMFADSDEDYEELFKILDEMSGDE